MTASIEFLTPYLEHLTYFGILTILVATGLGLPISEDLILITCGFLAYQGKIHISGALPICYLGVICGDLILYTQGYRYGQDILQYRWVKRFINQELVAKVKNYFDRYGNKTIFLARHIAGIRALTFLLAGVMKVKPINFLLIDSLSALLSVPLLITLGYLFANQIGSVERDLVQIEYLLAAALLLGIISLLAWKRYFRH